ncbi:MAG: hypothetical protein AABY64_03565 [Bdellovibrionota bacterium]
MKIILATLMILSASLAGFADEPQSKKDARNIANIFIHNPSLAQDIHAQNLSVLDFTSTIIKPGGLDITEYNFKLGRICECVPKYGSLKVIQDQTPIGHDGPTEYQIDLKITEKP